MLTEKNKELLNSLPPLTGTMAKLAFRLAETTLRLEMVLSQANAQFNAGDRHATFGKQTIESLNADFKERVFTANEIANALNSAIDLKAIEAEIDQIICSRVLDSTDWQFRNLRNCRDALRSIIAKTNN